MLFRQKHHAHAVFSGRRQCHALLGHLLPIKRVRQLNQNTCTVTHQRISPHSAAVIEVFKNLQTLLNDGMRLVPFDVRHKPHATSVVLMRG